MSIPLVKRQNELYHESHYMVDNQLVIFDMKISHEDALLGVEKRVRSTSFF